MMSPTPADREFLGISYDDWVTAYQRFGPHPEHAQREVEAIFQAVAMANSGGQFFYQLSSLMPLAKAYQLHRRLP